MGIQINGQTNNINAGIGSLSIEDLREIDIVGVATASNFKTGISNLHDVGLTLTGGQIDVGNNIKIGNAGIITASGLIATSYVSVGDDDTINVGNGNDLKIYHQSSDNNSYIENDTGNLIIRADAADKDITLQAADALIFNTSGANEKVRINSNGVVGIGTVNPHGSLHIHSGTPQLTLSDSDTGAHGQINCASSEGNLYVEVDKFSGITTAQHKPRFGVRLRGKEWFGITHNGTWRLDNGYGAMQSGSAGQVLTSGGPNSWARWTDQTDVLDMWKCSSDISNSDQTVRYFDLGDWTQLTGNPYANLGFIGAYESQGRFRMPSTGYYEISVIIGWGIYNATCKSVSNAIYTTTDNSTYTSAMESVIHCGGGQAGTNQSTNTLKLYWKVNNISYDKFRISYSSFNSNPYIRSAGTFLYIKKLRDL